MAIIKQAHQQLSSERGSDLLTVTEAAMFLRLKTSTIRAWILRRKVNYIKLGGRVFVRRSDLEALVETSVVPARISDTTILGNLREAA